MTPIFDILPAAAAASRYIPFLLTFATLETNSFLPLRFSGADMSFKRGERVRVARKPANFGHTLPRNRAIEKNKVRDDDVGPSARMIPAWHD